jgi:hypothetical protein
MTKTPKIILFDIESSPVTALVWGKVVDGPVLRVLEDWQLLCFSYKELGKKKVTVMSRKDYSERQLVKHLRDVIDGADIVIAQNGKKFDIRKLNAKIIGFDFKPPAAPQVVDTLLESRKYFGFTGHSLDELLVVLKAPFRKMKHPGLDMWTESMAGNKTMLTKMERYCARDTVGLEFIYNKMKGWMSNHPNLSQISGRPDSCPRCGNEKLHSIGVWHTKTATYPRFRCYSCNAVVRGRTAEKKEKPKYV